MPKEYIDLLPKEIYLDHAWNSRQSAGSEKLAEDPFSALSDEQFEASIKEQGVIQPPRVLKKTDGTWFLVFGYRRILASLKVAPNRKVRCLIQESTGDPALDDQIARIANLTENLQRRNLKPWEIADCLFCLKETHGSLSDVRIAEMTGLTRGYVSSLIRLRKKAHPKVWSQFVKLGTKLRIPYREVLVIVGLPMLRQPDAWNKCVDAHKPKVGRRGKSKKPGPIRLQRFLNATPSIRMSPDFRKGLSLGLGIALGQAKWKFALPPEVKKT